MIGAEGHGAGGAGVLGTSCPAEHQDRRVRVLGATLWTAFAIPGDAYRAGR